MKVRNNLTSDNSIADDLSFDEQSDSDYEISKRKPLPIKKALLVSVMAISLGIVLNGVSTSYQNEIHGAVAIEESKWSDFDCTQVNSYFDVLSDGTNYKLLNAMCTSDSKVYSSVVDNEGKMQVLYDENYGIAQAIQKYGSLLSVNTIYGVSESKVSLSINYVSEEDAIEYFNENSNDLCRYFTNHEVSKENLVRELFNLLETYEISTTKTVIELPVEIKDGVYNISDDSIILDLLTNSYNNSIDEMTKQISMHR